MDIREGYVSHPRIQKLLELHMRGMHENSPPESVHALDNLGLSAKNIKFWSIWQNGDPIGCGALKEISPKHGEIKSMRTHPRHLRQGVAELLLEHMLAFARGRGYVRLSLETGSGETFEPALNLYRKLGFKNGAPFGDYEP